MNLVEEARNGRKFLFLGSKGSGKSALGEHLKLVSQNDPSLFVEFVNIADVSFQTFSQILRGNIEPEARYPKVWSWLLLLFLLSSFKKDQGSNFAVDESLFLTFEALRELGLVPEPSLSRAVSTTSEKTFSLRLGGVLVGLEAGRKTVGNQDLPFFIDRLKLTAERFQSSSKHLLIIDGFDELLRRRNLQYDALGALVFEANRLNLDFARAQVPAKIIVLCRTDLFERLPGPNKNKIRQNAAVQLDWYSDPRRPETSSLVTLVNRRAALTAGRQLDVFATYLPPTLSLYGGNIRGQLLDYTRLSPRDMICLFLRLQQYSGDEPMTVGQVNDALAAYSRDYLVPEILDEMDGYIGPDDIDFMKRLLGTVRKARPSIGELEDQAEKMSRPTSFDLMPTLNLLFECSAIGNVFRSPGGNERAVFKCRDRHASFNEFQQIMVHRGLWRGLNLAE